MKISFTPIGIIHSPFRTPQEMPIQPTGEASRPGVVEIYPEFAPALKDLDGFSHLYLLYYFHQVQHAQLVVIPFLDTQPRGLFATRAPHRPNPIGLSLVQLVRIDKNRIHIANLDVLDGTPLLDVKPYIPEFESAQDVRVGWLEAAKGQVRHKKADGRFAKP
ncbi:MAG TPA: tRNA (N6-threonylcarbamoyladenosine(37)-N6)-methyltransferase TrmO [Anaerolineales bacterium]|nr:tRNA (N6-threonylcarbamoyladenosine(37)-N6)-methyltransferase TrmO [Anaerolineales bacterium]